MTVPPKLVGDIESNWDDMSPFVVHFTKKTDRTEYENAISILFSRRLEARARFGAGKGFVESPKCVCLSEAPLHQLKRLADQRGPYGLGFRKEFIVGRGGGPILYAYQGTPHAQAIENCVKAAIGKPHDPIWRLAPFVDRPGVYGSNSYFFEWEREWRYIGDLDFNETDPAFLIIPEYLHSAARSFFDDAALEHSGPSYNCRFIDPYWDLEQVNAALGP